MDKLHTPTTTLHELMYSAQRLGASDASLAFANYIRDNPSIQPMYKMELITWIRQWARNYDGRPPEE
jgi:hypothetical protein